MHIRVVREISMTNIPVVRDFISRSRLRCFSVGGGSVCLFCKSVEDCLAGRLSDGDCQTRPQGLHNSFYFYWNIFLLQDCCTKPHMTSALCLWSFYIPALCEAVSPFLGLMQDATRHTRKHLPESLLSTECVMPLLLSRGDAERVWWRQYTCHRGECFKGRSQ